VASGEPKSCRIWVSEWFLGRRQHKRTRDRMGRLSLQFSVSSVLDAVSTVHLAYTDSARLSSRPSGLYPAPRGPDPPPLALGS
jgi:hypothetical protein